MSLFTLYSRAAPMKAAVPERPRNLFLRVRPYLPRPTFILLHWIYIVTISVVSSLIFWHFSIPRGSVSYVDSLFLVIAATTHCGLNTLNLSSLNTFQQCIIFVHMICGNQIFVSAFVVHVRKHAFHRRFKRVAEEKESREKSGSIPQPPPWTASYTANMDTHPTRQTLHSAANSSHNSRLRVEPSFTSLRNRNIAEEAQAHTSSTCAHDEDEHHGLDAAHDPKCICRAFNHGPIEHIPRRGTVDRNAQFHGLSPEEREHLRCVEYQAVRLLSYVVPIYIMSWQVLGCVTIGTWMAFHGQAAADAYSVTPWWAGVFFATAGFNNIGMSLLDTSVVPFQRSVFFLLVMAILMLAGNTAYPLFLRSILKATLYFLPDRGRYKPWRETILFVLKYPRRVYTYLFPTRQTWWLCFMLLVVNGVDWTAFEVLNRKNPAVTALPMGYRLLDGLFQSLAVRSSGFAVISIGSLAVGLQALYIMMMYISAFPVAITMRNSNVYEERSLGIYAEDIQLARREKELHSQDSIQRTRLYFIRHQVQRQLGHDLWFIIICMILVVWIETDSYERDPIVFSTFSIIFEVVSAYGCVGLSIGLPNQDYSFCGAWHPAGKLIICALMLRGRHRGLPVAIDKAVQLPGEKEGAIEEEDQEIREARTRQVSRVGV